MWDAGITVVIDPLCYNTSPYPMSFLPVTSLHLLPITSIKWLSPMTFPFKNFLERSEFPSLYCCITFSPIASVTALPLITHVSARSLGYGILENKGCVSLSASPVSFRPLPWSVCSAAVCWWKTRCLRGEDSDHAFVSLLRIPQTLVKSCHGILS